MVDYKKQGKNNRAAGKRFELKVRKDLESKGWVVDKWSNNVEDICYANKNGEMEVTENCSFKDALGSDGTFPIKKLVPAKNKFLGPGKPMMLGAGFPDFISFKYEITKFIGALNGPTQTKFYEVIGVESKSNGQLNKIEKEKCTWLLKNNIFSKILIASKGTKRGEIIYKDFNNNN